MAMLVARVRFCEWFREAVCSGEVNVFYRLDYLNDCIICLFVAQQPYCALRPPHL
jgi:hypothetical protein